MRITKQEVDELEILMGQLTSIHTELTALSKKSPNDAVNKFKLELINTVIGRCNTFLGDKHRPFKEFGSFDIDAVMSNSDVTFVVSLYLQAFENYRSDRIKLELGDWYYDTAGEPKIQTAPPAKIKE